MNNKELILRSVICSSGFQTSINNEVHGLGYWSKRSVVRAFFFPLLCVIALGDYKDAGRIRGSMILQDLINVHIIGQNNRPLLSAMLKMLTELDYIYITNEKDIHNIFSAKEYKLTRKGKAMLNEFFELVDNYEFFENPRPGYK